MGRTKRTDDQLQVEEVAIFGCLIKLCGHHAVPAQIPQLPFNGRTADRRPSSRAPSARRSPMRSWLSPTPSALRSTVRVMSS